MGNEQGKVQGGPTPAGIQTMDESLQKKFSKGIQYNMKIVIRGDRNSGKTTLFHRMEGKPFNEAYIPTNEIQVTSILWSYRVTNDTVKVEIWDIVDKARPQTKDKGKVGGLKMFNETVEEVEVGGEENGQALDASFLDVYKGAHGVVFIFDIIKQWTWKYVERELSRVPLHVPVIILANFCDMCEHRLVNKEDCIMAIKYLDRPEGAAEVRYAECSLKNGFGLMHLHKFLSVPFLQLQQETLLQQLQVNREQMMAAMEELNTAVHTEDQNYEKYMAKLDRMAEEKKRKIMMARLQHEQQQTDNQSEDSLTSSNTRQPQPATPPTRSSTTQSDVSRSHTQQGQTAAPQRSGSFSSKFSSRFSGFLGKGKEEKAPENDVQVVRPSKPRTSSRTNIEEFVPEGGGVDDFLDDDEDEEEEEEEEEEEDEEEDSDEDSPAGNPLIAADEDLSSPDEAEVVAPPKRSGTTPTTSRGKKQPAQVSSSESEEDEQPAILTPVKVPTPKQSKKSKVSPKQLKSAKDIVLTESEEEEEKPQVMADEDIDFGIKKDKSRGKGLENIFEPVPVVAPKKKQTGLMLQFDPSITSAHASSKPSKPATKDVQESPKASPSLNDRRGEKKKKKSKRSKHDKEGDTKETVKKTKETTNVTSTEPQMSNDPFGPISSLDAWLNSTSNDLPQDILTPVQATGTTEMGTEEGLEDGETKSKKTKKHKHRKHREDRHEDWDGDGEERSSSKKKHRSHHHHHKSSHHRRLEQDD